MKIDETDLKIIELLKEDARIPYSEIANKVHLTRAAVRKRIKELEKMGAILGYTVQINSVALDRRIYVFIYIEVGPNYIEDVAKKLVENKNIAIVSQHTGFSGLHVHAFIPNTSQLSAFLTENIYNLRGILNVKTSLLIKNYKTNAYLC